MFVARCGLSSYSILTTTHKVMWWIADGHRHKFLDILPLKGEVFFSSL
jgi:hypothetical protein